MFVVKINFKYLKNGKVVEASCGDSLPDFSEWPYATQKAHLDLGWVVKEDDQAQGFAPAEEKRPRHQHKKK